LPSWAPDEVVPTGPSRDPVRRHFLTASPHEQGADVRALFTTVVGAPELRDALERARTPGEADAIGSRVSPTRNLGDSVSFSEYLCWLATRDQRADHNEDGTTPSLVDWNLDADRGY